MNKTEYLERSRKLRTPQRCPFVGYCQRWMYSVYFHNYYTGDDSKDAVAVLKRYGELAEDFDNKSVECEIDPPSLSKGKDNYQFANFCPEVNLFQPRHSPSFEPNTALTSLYWNMEEGIVSKEYKHFSECLEYIRNHHQKSHKKSKRSNLSPKERFTILERDGFTCQYCGRTPKDGIVLHVDHITSVHDKGSNETENLITSCAECNFGKGKKSISRDLIDD